MTPQRYQKRPVVVEAVRVDEATIEQIHAWIEREGGRAWLLPSYVIAIDTPEGVMRAEFGDWVIREPFPTDHRAFYPCKASIFDRCYEAETVAP